MSGNYLQFQLKQIRIFAILCGRGFEIKENHYISQLWYLSVKYNWCIVCDTVVILLSYFFFCIWSPNPFIVYNRSHHYFNRAFYSLHGAVRVVVSGVAPWSCFGRPECQMLTYMRMQTNLMRQSSTWLCSIKPFFCIESDNQNFVQGSDLSCLLLITSAAVFSKTDISDSWTELKAHFYLYGCPFRMKVLVRLAEIGPN